MDLQERKRQGYRTFDLNDGIKAQDVEAETFPPSLVTLPVRMGYGWDCDLRSIWYFDLGVKCAGGIGTATFHASQLLCRSPGTGCHHLLTKCKVMLFPLFITSVSNRQS